MTYTVHPGAESDLADASDFYITQAGEKLSRRFLAEFDRVVGLLDRNPDAGVLQGNGRRIYHMQVFPYSVVYRIIATGIQVLVVRHQSRRPSHGMRRG